MNNNIKRKLKIGGVTLLAIIIVVVVILAVKGKGVKSGDKEPTTEAAVEGVKVEENQGVTEGTSKRTDEVAVNQDKELETKLSNESKDNTIIEETKISEESSKNAEEQTKTRVLSVSDETTIVNPQTDSSHSASNQAEINQPERIEFNVGSYDYYELYGHSGYQMELEDKDFSGTVYADSEIVSMRYKIENVKRKLLKEDTITPEKQWVIKDIPLYLGGCYITVYATLSNGHELTNEVWIFNDHEERMQGLNADMSDKDGDGLEADIEEIYGTNPNNADTDGDGLNDYIELVEIGTDPLKADSDGDGRPDGDDDADEDGLTNIEEARLGTYTWGSYTDEDLLSDYEEVKIYGTDPLNRDTDGDGKDDDWEVENGYNPLVADIYFSQNVIEAADATTMVLTVKATGDKLATLTAVAASEDMFINDTIPGFIDAGYDFHIDGEFEEANLMCYFDPSLMETKGFKPTVYYYDEDNHTLEEVETFWNGKNYYVTAKLEHFSRYVLVDKNKYTENIYVPSEYEKLTLLDVARTQYEVNSLMLVSDENRYKVYYMAYQFLDSAHFTRKPISWNMMVTPSCVESCSISEDRYSGWRIYSYDDFDLWTKNNKPNKYPESWKTSWDAFATQLNGNGNINRGFRILVIDETGANMILSNPKIPKLHNGYGKVYYIGDVDERIYDLFPDSQYIIVKCDTLQDYINTVMKEVDYTVDLEYDEETASKQKNDIRKYYKRYHNIEVFPVFEDNSSSEDKRRDYYKGLIDGNMVRLPSGAVLPKSILTLVNDNPAIIDDLDFQYDNGVKVNLTESVILQLPDPEGKYANLKYYDMERLDINTLLANDSYLGSYFANDYLHNNVLKTQLWVGNKLINHKFSEKQMYKKALYEMFKLLNETMIEDYSVKAYKKGWAESVSNIKDALDDLNALNAIPDDLNKPSILVSANIKEWDEFTNLLDLSQEATTLAEAGANMEDISRIRKQIMKWVDEATEAHSNDYKKYNSYYLTGKGADKLRKFSYKIPTSIRKIYADAGKIVEYGSYGVTIVDSFFEAKDSVMALSVLDGQYEIYELYKELLRYMIIYSKNDNNKEAMREIQASIGNDSKRFEEKAWAIADSFISGLVDVGGSLMVNKLNNPLLWAVDLGLSLGDMVFHVGDVDEKAMYTIAIGDAANALAKPLRNWYYDGVGKYCEVEESKLSFFSVLCQLRIMAENNYWAMTDAAVIKVNKSEAKVDVIDNIKRVMAIVRKYGFSATAKYKGAKISVD